MIELRVVGVPAPQGSKTAFVRGGRAIVAEGKGPGRQRHADWRQAVATAARDYLEAHPRARPIRGPVQVAISFRFPPTRSDPYRTRHTTKPDVDKLARSVLDSLVSAGILVDDSLVCHLSILKRYEHVEPPGAVILLAELDGLEAADRERLKTKAARARKENRAAGS